MQFHGDKMSSSSVRIHPKPKRGPVQRFYDALCFVTYWGRTLNRLLFYGYLGASTLRLGRFFEISGRRSRIFLGHDLTCQKVRDNYYCPRATKLFRTLKQYTEGYQSWLSTTLNRDRYV